MKDLVIVRGAGDIASGTIYKLYKAGFHVVALETKKPTSIRRKVSFSEAVFDGECYVEDVKATLVPLEDALNYPDDVVITVDPELSILKNAKPVAIVDAILAKRNLGTNSQMAPIVIGVGPGFTASDDVHAVIETSRGHDLGRIIYDGQALPNTGVPGIVGGEDRDRVFHAPIKGMITSKVNIGDIVEKGNHVLDVSGTMMVAPFDGVIRGILRDGTNVPKGMKIADIDPRLSEVKNCYTISDKARTIAGAVLEAIMYLRRENHE